MCIKNEKKITARLRELKGDASITAFARKCGIKQPIVDRYFRRGYEPKLDQMIMICRAHGCSLDWLAGVSETKETSEGLPESEWRERALAAERKLEKYDGYLDLVVHGHEEMLKGIQGIAKMRKEKDVAK